MAKWRYVYLENDKVLTGDSGTYTIDLPGTGFLSSVLIKYKDTRPSFTNGVLPAFAAITKLEIVDGSRVIQSLSGAQAQALMFYRGQAYGNTLRSEIQSSTAVDYFRLNLGLYNQDPLHMLDLSRLTSPQLKITWDGTQTSVDGLTYDAGSSISAVITAVATICDSQPAGFTDTFVQSSQIHSYTQVAGATEYVDIPRDRPLLGILVRGAYKDKLVRDDFNKVRLNINNGEWIPFEFEDLEIEQKQAEWFGKAVNVMMKVSVKSGSYIDTGLGEVYGCSITPLGNTPIHDQANTLTGGYLKVYSSDLATPSEYTTVHSVLIKASGLFPHHTFYFPMDKVVADGKTLDVTEFKRVVLECTSSSSASSSSVPTIVAEYLEKN